MIHYGTDSVAFMQGMSDASVDFVLADPPYSTFPLINRSIREALRISRHGCAYFMYGEDIQQLDVKPDRVCYWVKPISTKNTIKSYSRFVEVLCLFQYEFFDERMHWSNRSGIFTDALIHEGNLHPFAKPESLIQRLLLSHCPKGGLVVDPFAGSGTVDRVATRLGYHSISIEWKKIDGNGRLY